MVKRTEPLPEYTTPASLAWATGYSEFHLSRMAQEGMPKTGRGEYPVDGAIKWLLTRKDPSAKATIQDAKKALIEEQIEATKIDNAKRRGELIPVEEVQHALNSLAVIISTQLDGLAPRVAHELAAVTGVPAAQVQDIVFREARAIREAISHGAEHYRGLDAGGGEDRQAAAEPKRRRVGRPKSLPAAGES